MSSKKWTASCVRVIYPTAPTNHARLVSLCSHHTQTTHWDPPRGIRELQLLQQLRDFLAAQKEKLKVRKVSL